MTYKGGPYFVKCLLYKISSHLDQRCELRVVVETIETEWTFLKAGHSQFYSYEKCQYPSRIDYIAKQA